MAHHAEPMDIDDESVFDNKENTYHHTNVVPKTPCTEKGYEELDVSELNMKLRYSITPAASPMSKSMSQCLDNRYNISTDESVNNTVINEYENNLTRSLNSTLNKTDIKSSKFLPLQSLPTDIDDSNRSTTVLRSLDSTVTANDITVTVCNENDIDNLSFPSSSSSMAHTPEATTPTKEVPKHDGGSPIMRGLKSVLSMFRSSQSPIPPGDDDAKASDASIKPADVPLPELKPQAVASTPKSENIKERNVSRRNSPFKESIIFNEDLEKELQWSDDSTIVFSTEKIPVHKLFFQEKSSKSAIMNEDVQQEDANSTVEYMDVSYNNISVRDRTLNGTANKSKVNELQESDGEFVDCETTFTQNEEASNKEEIDTCNAINNNQGSNVPDNKLVENIAAVNEPFSLDTTKDIINLIESCQNVLERDIVKELDFSTNDIVNQLSDLINEVENENNINKNVNTVILDNTKSLILSDVQTVQIVQPELIQNQVTSPVNSATEEETSSTAFAEEVRINDEKLIVTRGFVSDVTHLKSDKTKISSISVDDNCLNARENCPQIPKYDETKIIKSQEGTNDSGVGCPSPVDIPLPNEDDINDNLPEDAVDTVLQDNYLPVASTSQRALMEVLDKSITEEKIQQSELKLQNIVIACPPNLLTTDVPLLNTDDHLNVDERPHESTTAAIDFVPTDKNPDNNSCEAGASNVDLIIKSITEITADISCVQNEPENIKTDIPISTNISSTGFSLPAVDNNDPIKMDILLRDDVTVVPDLIQQYATDESDIISIESNSLKTETDNEAVITAPEGVEYVCAKEADVVTVSTMDLIIPEKEEHMEISFVEHMNDKFSNSLAMDVSMVDVNAKINDSFNQPEPCQKIMQVLNTFPEITNNLKSTISVDVENAILKQALERSDESDYKIDTTITKEKVLKTETDTGHDLSMIDTCKSLDIVNENVIISTDLKTRGNIETMVNPNMIATVTSSLLEKCELGTVNKMDANVENANSESKTADTLKLDNVIEGAPEIVNSLNKTSTIVESVVSLTNKHVKAISNEKGACEVKDDTSLENLPRGSDSTLHLTQNTSKCEEKTDEEIVISESNSPFVSMSAEEFVPESKKDDFEEMENPISTKSKGAQSPPPSPKIVSKGYNLNFDDIDNINPFATKTKIRMSPPPEQSPNISVAVEDNNKTEIDKHTKKNKNENRRKSMPERKKPLKAKRHLNSTFDSTETALPKTITSKERDAHITAKVEPKQEQSLLSESQIDVNLPSTPVHDKAEVAIQNDISTQENSQNEFDGTSAFDDCKKTTTISADEIAINKETKQVDHAAMGDSLKSPVIAVTSSSSEQSTYFSACASSTELTESKNVFNLPEIDDFNPFATKLKIRHTPPRDLADNAFATKTKIISSPETSVVVSQRNDNCTETMNKENELKEATYNLSGSSKNSDEKDVTIQSVHTEDEDTLEGPFLEADDGYSEDKVTESIDNKLDMVDVDNLNQQENEEAGEMFIDAEAFEFLMNQNKSDEVAYSGKESLFLKFDPLFDRRVTLNEIKRKQTTPKKTSKQEPLNQVEHLSHDEPIAGPSELNNTCEIQKEERSDDINITASKPMMAVTPAVNPVVTPRKSFSPNISNRLSMTFTSPAISLIDRLLSLSGNSPSAALDTTATNVDGGHNDADQALTQLRELLAEKEINVYNLRCESKELKSRLTILESQMKALEAESAERLKKVNELNENLAEKTKMNRNMAAVVEEYERTIASLISETEQDKKRFAEERNQIIRDRDEQTAHLASMEVSFNDLHSKYEKSKQVIMGYKTNEDAYKKSIQEFEDNLSKMHSNYELLKQHAASKLNHANQELEKINKAHEAEVLKFNAMIKRKELHITSLEESLAQKTKANEELTAICDELINKVG